MKNQHRRTSERGDYCHGCHNKHEDTRARRIPVEIIIDGFVRNGVVILTAIVVVAVVAPARP